mgnify:CR=1 FL=1
MPSLPLYDLNKKKIGSIELNDTVFAGEIKPHLLNDAVRAKIARKYEYKTANALIRTEVHGTKKKAYKQKGTGQARHGAITAPIFVGGGKAFGPRPHRRTFKLNKKVRKAALISALSLNQKSDKLFIVDKLELEKASAKTIAAYLKAFGITSALFVNSGDTDAEKTFNSSTRNINKVKHLRPEGVNVFDILKFKNILVSQKAAQKLTERLTHA